MLWNSALFVSTVRSFDYRQWDMTFVSDSLSYMMSDWKRITSPDWMPTDTDRSRMSHGWMDGTPTIRSANRFDWASVSAAGATATGVSSDSSTDTAKSIGIEPAAMNSVDGDHKTSNDRDADTSSRLTLYPSHIEYELTVVNRQRNEWKKWFRPQFAGNS